MDPTNMETSIPLLKKKNGNKKLLFKVTLGIAGILAGWLAAYLLYFQFRESTDDAYLAGNMVNVSPVINGAVTAFYADNTDYVEEGQLLVELDRTSYALEYGLALANLSTTALQTKKLYEDVVAHQAALQESLVIFSKALYDYQNRIPLVDIGAVSQQDYTHAKDAVAAAEAAVEQARAELLAAQALVGSFPIREHPLLQKAKEEVRTAYYHLAHCSIYAPVSGYVAQRTVNVGQSVTKDTTLLAVLPIDYVWVDANFKETQLRHMRIGQPTILSFDLYGREVVYKGKVLGIGSGTGSVFSLLPPQNATGNWIKIVQRIPVRVSLDPKMLAKYPPRLGLSATVKVNTSDRDLPMLTTHTSAHTVGSTRIFALDFSKVDQQIEAILDEGLLPLER